MHLAEFVTYMKSFFYNRIDQTDCMGDCMKDGDHISFMYNNYANKLSHSGNLLYNVFSAINSVSAIMCHLYKLISKPVGQSWLHKCSKETRHCECHDLLILRCLVKRE